MLGHGVAQLWRALEPCLAQVFHALHLLLFRLFFGGFTAFDFYVSRCAQRFAWAPSSPAPSPRTSAAHTPLPQGMALHHLRRGLRFASRAEGAAATSLCVHVSRAVLPYLLPRPITLGRGVLDFDAHSKPSEGVLTPFFDSVRRRPRASRGRHILGNRRFTDSVRLRPRAWH